MGPQTTGSILVIFGHGATYDGTSFVFKRAPNHRCNLYFWTREGIGIGSDAADRIANNALRHGRIESETARVIESRMGGQLVTDHVIARFHTYDTPIDNWLQQAYQTALPGLDATLYHNQWSLHLSDRIVLVPDFTNTGVIKLSQILDDINLRHRSLDILWAACR